MPTGFRWPTIRHPLRVKSYHFEAEEENTVLELCWAGFSKLSNFALELFVKFDAWEERREKRLNLFKIVHFQHAINK